jgi:hypothetical protein
VELDLTWWDHIIDDAVEVLLEIVGINSNFI